MTSAPNAGTPIVRATYGCDYCNGQDSGMTYNQFAPTTGAPIAYFIPYAPIAGLNNSVDVTSVVQSWWSSTTGINKFISNSNIDPNMPDPAYGRLKNLVVHLSDGKVIIIQEGQYLVLPYNYVALTQNGASTPHTDILVPYHTKDCHTSYYDPYYCGVQQ